MSGVKRAIFVAGALEEKEEWIAAIELAITRNSGLIKSSEKSPLESGVIVTPVRSSRSRRLASRPASTSAVCTASSPDSSVV